MIYNVASHNIHTEQLLGDKCKRNNVTYKQITMCRHLLMLITYHFFNITLTVATKKNTYVLKTFYYRPINLKN